MKRINLFGSFFLVILLVSFLGCAPTATKEGTGEYIDDSVITTKVKAVILKEGSLKSTEINVETFKGVVQLSGFVNSQADINKAIEITRSVKGVRSVTNSMRIKQESSSAGEYIDDAAITTKVKAAILQEGSLKSTEINVETFKGVVQLSGFVNSQADINKAVEVTRNVKGVKSVTNSMRLK
jgi:hyperosmotically inducible protein